MLGLFAIGVMTEDKQAGNTAGTPQLRRMNRCITAKNVAVLFLLHRHIIRAGKFHACMHYSQRMSRI